MENDDDNPRPTSHKDLHPIDTLAQPVLWLYRFYKRLKLFPWWLRYNTGIAKESVLKDKIIIQLAADMGLQDKLTSRLTILTFS
jgi:hypothetical protein